MDDQKHQPDASAPSAAAPPSTVAGSASDDAKSPASSSAAHAASPAKKKGFGYGWLMIGACGLVYSFLGAFGLTVGQIAIPVMVTDPAIMMDRAMVGLGFTVFVLLQGLPAPLIGAFVAKKGARTAMITSGIVLVVTGILLAQFCGTSTFAYFALFGVLLSAGGALGSQVPCQTTISTWFVRKRGMAMAIMMAIAGCLGFVYPVLVNGVIVGTGSWSNAFYLISIMAVLGLIIAVVFIRNKPQDKGLEADGGEETEAESVEAKKSAARVYKATEHKTAAQALKTPAFWLFLLAGLPLYFGLNMQVSAGVLHFTGAGLDSTTVALGVSVQAISAVAARLLVAPLADRIEPSRLLAFAGAIMLVSMCAAGFCSTANPVLLFAFYACVGVGFGINIVCLPTCYANYFGFTNYPKIIGWVLPLLSIIAGTIPVLAGVIFNMTGAYNAAFFGTAACCVVGVVCALAVRFPKKS